MHCWRENDDWFLLSTFRNRVCVLRHRAGSVVNDVRQQYPIIKKCPTKKADLCLFSVGMLFN